jgi:dienelactone hydrolase
VETGPMISPSTSVRRTLLLAAAIVLGFLTPAPAVATAPKLNCASAGLLSLAWLPCEAANVALTGQNPTQHPDLLSGIRKATFAYQRARLRALAADPERRPIANACTTVVLCPIDPRLEGWAARGGLVAPVLYTSRSGGTISGHIWASATGPAKRPAVVVTNGSIIGYEEGWWYLAQSLSRAGFVVMTFDVQGEGMSDQFGEAPDEREDAFAGTPLLGLLGPRPLSVDTFGGNGLPFYDGAQDALDFLLSTPAHPFVPRRSRMTRTSHAAKQERRVAAGLNAANNPLWRLVDPDRIGVTGHSYGAQAASWLGQKDPRVDAVVALDTLCVPASPSPDELVSLGSPAPDFGGLPYVTYGFNKTCFSTPPGPAPAITKPALGITGDYLLAPIPYLAPPNPLGKSRASLAYSRAGVDTGQIVVRGGTHLSFADLPIVAPGSARAIDMTTWYTTAWFAKYLQHERGADAMLLTRRWLDDASTRALDPLKDANLFSWHFRSRLDIVRTGGTRVRCENLRAGCAALVPRAADGWRGEYSMVAATR